MWNLKSTLLCAIYCLVCWVHGFAAQDCTDRGRDVGLDINSTVSQTVAAPATKQTYILNSYGGINCYGKLTKWTFTRSYKCENIAFQVWRKQGNDYLLVGENYYDFNIEGCIDDCSPDITTYIPPETTTPPPITTENVTMDNNTDIVTDIVSTFGVTELTTEEFTTEGITTNLISTVESTMFNETTSYSTDEVTTVQMDTTTPSCEEMNQLEVFLIPAHQQIPVEPDDIIGWSIEGSLDPSGPGMLTFDPMYNDTIDLYYCTDVVPGSICVYTGVNNTETGGFLVQAHVVKGEEPDIANLPYVVDVYENYGAIDASDIYSVKASHVHNNEEMDTTMSYPVPLQFSVDNNLFYITGVTGIPADVYFSGTITLDQDLDYEVKRQHSVNVTVEGHSLTSTRELIVKVLDVNEQHSIDNINKEFEVHAMVSKKGDQIFQVMVSDPDTINPSTIEYFITTTDKHGTTPDPPFVMDRYTGIVTVSQDLDTWIGPSKYILTVMTTDYMYQVTAAFTVNILGIRNAPVIQNLDSSIDIREDAPDGSEIFQVVVDGVPGSVFHYSIASVDPFNLTAKFGIHENGWIFLSSNSPALDSTTIVNPVEIKVEVSDGYQTSSTGTLYVTIQWVNRAPVFVPELYKVRIPEVCGLENGGCNPNTTYPWTIPHAYLKINVYDRDSANGMDNIQCSILPGIGSQFFAKEIQDCTTLNMIKKIDVNDEPQFMDIDLTIRVIDNGGLSDTAVVLISVYDINDNAPLFEQNKYDGEIEENTAGGVSVLTVSATDKDFDKNGEVTYSIDNRDNEGNMYFQVHPKTGVLYTKQAVDYEALPQSLKFISFHVIATDGGDMPKTDRINVTILIKDVNDNHPIYTCDFPLTYPRGYDPYDPDYLCFYNLDVPFDTLINFNILTFYALDKDTVSSVVTYYILNMEPHFRIDNINGQGVLFTNARLYNYHMYALIVMGKDSATERHPALKARPPSVVRIDTFNPAEHLVDITLGFPGGTFSKTEIAMEFIPMLRDYVHPDPWFIRLQAIKEEPDSTTVTIYALLDNSTFLHSNFENTKHFIHVNDLLHKYRKNIKGDPRDDFKNITSKFEPVEVMPTHPKFFIHTIGGIVTMVLLCLFFLFVIVGIIVGICKCMKVACFRPPKPTKHAWMADNFYDTHDKTTLSDDNNSVNSDYMYPSNKSRRTTANTRRPSLDTIHSMIYDTKDKVT